ncbi:MAG: outer membrane protein [Bradyrhizobium sp.]
MILATQQAVAADMAVKARPIAPLPPPYDWTGFYVGGHLGWGWQSDDPSVVSCNCGGVGGMAGMGIPPSFTSDGFLGGLQAGYNWQLGSPWVVGVEGEVAWADIKGGTSWSVNGEPHTFSDRSKWIDDVAARFGYAIDRSLIYGKVGWAWTRDDFEHTHQMPGPVFHDLTGSIDRNGWLVGVGFEYAFMPNLSAKIEWNYIGLGGSDVITADGFGNSATFHADSHINIIKAGLNYRFGGPVVARY